MTYRLGYCKTVIWKGERVFCTAAEEQEAEHICACLNALEGIDLSTLRDGWLADLIQRLQAAPPCLVQAVGEARGQER